jgi:hypothetical protein
MLTPQRLTPTVITIQAINTAVGAFSNVFSPSGPVLEVGSCYPAGYEKLCDRRAFFPGLEYVGCDLRRGCGVDRVEDAPYLSFSDGSFGAVILLEILEHVPKPELALSEAKRVLARTGF